MRATKIAIERETAAHRFDRTTVPGNDLNSSRGVDRRTTAQCRPMDGSIGNRTFPDAHNMPEGYQPPLSSRQAGVHLHRNTFARRMWPMSRSGLQHWLLPPHATNRPARSSSRRSAESQVVEPSPYGLRVPSGSSTIVERVLPQSEIFFLGRRRSAGYDRAAMAHISRNLQFMPIAARWQPADSCVILPPCLSTC